MKESQESHAHCVTQDLIDGLATKLSTWSQGLPEGERSIAMLLVEHAREFTPRTVDLTAIAVDLRSAAKGVLDTLMSGDARKGSWMRQGWVQQGPGFWSKQHPKVAGEEDIELVQRIIITCKR